MKTFIVYDLDAGLPIAVGNAIKAEWARAEVSDKNGIKIDNLIAQEVGFFPTGLDITDEQKNSKPNPRIMKRPLPPIDCRPKLSIKVADAIFAENEAALNHAEKVLNIASDALAMNAEALKRAQRYSTAISKLQKEGKKIPTYDEWLKDDSAKNIE